MWNSPWNYQCEIQVHDEKASLAGSAWRGVPTQSDRPVALYHWLFLVWRESLAAGPPSHLLGTEADGIAARVNMHLRDLHFQVPRLHRGEDAVENHPGR